MSSTRDVNAQYNRARGGGLTDRVSRYARRRMYARFLAAGVEDDDTILDVGVTSDREQLASNYLEAWHPRSDRITACGLDDAGFLEQQYPGLRFVRGDGRRLPFRSGSFDWVHSSAVLEHVGAAAEQAVFLSELHRVARKGMFATTPNRWFPVEFHTVLPLLHWLPPRWFRSLLGALGHRHLASEEHLNLMGRGDLAAACAQAGLERWRIESVRLGGWPSNLLLVVRKDAGGVRMRPGAVGRPVGGGDVDGA